MTYVKQNDVWHIVDEDGLPDPHERRPHLRAMCGRKVHTGTFGDTSIDEKPIVCGDKAHREMCAKMIEAMKVDLEKEGLTAADKETIERMILECDRFCTGG